MTAPFDAKALYPPPDELCARCGHPARDHDEDYIDVRTACLAEGCSCSGFERPRG